MRTARARTRLGIGIRPADDTGSIALAMLLTLVGVALSALLVPMLLTQAGSTRESVQRVHAVHAAQAGLDVALGHIRAATESNGDGVLAKLPCSSAGTADDPQHAGVLAGDMGGGTARYKVTIYYLNADPHGKAQSWLDSPANRISCSAGGGPADTPAYAFLRSKGTDQPTGLISSAQGRTLEATYTFLAAHENVDSGAIRLFKNGTNLDLCMDAGSTSPPAGTTLRMQPCTGAASQNFAYGRTLTVTLVGSKTESMPLGMCLDAITPHVEGQVVQFQPCVSATTPPPRQVWINSDGGNLYGTANGTSLDGYCMVPETPDSPGGRVILHKGKGKECSGNSKWIETFSFDASVGAGAAGPLSGQLVNFGQFGRCLDVTLANTNTEYLIAWYCKQAPDPADVSWNQKWAVPTINPHSSQGFGRIITTKDGSNFCLRSPLSTITGANYPTLTPCPGGTGTMWTVYGDTGNYTSSYRIVDSAGYCLTPSTTELNAGGQVNKIVMAACSGSKLHKWNAPPTVRQPTFKDITEK